MSIHRCLELDDFPMVQAGQLAEMPGRLSPSTERADRGMKFDCYRTLESIRTYVLVSQVEARIECYSRQVDASWRYEVAAESNALLRLEALGCELRLPDVYARVVFPPESALEIAQ